jgi:hypothetical protein
VDKSTHFRAFNNSEKIIDIDYEEVKDEEPKQLEE